MYDLHQITNVEKTTGDVSKNRSIVTLYAFLKLRNHDILSQSTLNYLILDLSKCIFPFDIFQSCTERCRRIIEIK